MLLQIAAATVLATVFSSPHLADATILRMESNLGGFNVDLYDTQAPLTVANFLNYVNRSDYNYTVIHRSAVTGTHPVPFVIQVVVTDAVYSGLSITSRRTRQYRMNSTRRAQMCRYHRHGQNG